MTLRTRFIAFTLIFCFSCGSGYADVIYLTDGSVLLVKKAWEEAEEVKYTNNEQIGTLPKSRVLRIQQEKETPARRRPSDGASGSRRAVPRDRVSAHQRRTPWLAAALFPK